MNSPNKKTEEEFGDPTTSAFWEAARAHRLIVQKCEDCGRHQFYPRPFCLGCNSKRLLWREVSGKGTVYSLSEVIIPPAEGIKVPYVVAIVELEEGPRLMTNIVNGRCGIGDPVKLYWAHRNGYPPLPMFEPVKR